MMATAVVLDPWVEAEEESFTLQVVITMTCGTEK
jgi:hypothetical protein